jgi:CHAD domain-containing protein
MIRLVLRRQLKAIWSLRERALDWSDPEGVHEMRVLSRRMRSSISDFQPHLRKPAIAIGKLRTIAKSLGAVRDEDVALAALEQLAAQAPAAAVEGIEILVEERRQRQAKARAVLMKTISATALKEFRTGFQTQIRSLALPTPKPTRVQTPAAAPLTFRELGTQAINGRLKDFRAAVRAIYSPFGIKKIHELRILAKRMRYAVELFRFCWNEDLNETAKEIALLQTSLGELHDCDVWIDYLGKRLKSVTRKDKGDPEREKLRAGYTWLLQEFSRQRTNHYLDALQRWQHWESSGFLDELKSQITETKGVEQPTSREQSPR